MFLLLINFNVDFHLLRGGSRGDKGAQAPPSSPKHFKAPPSSSNATKCLKQNFNIFTHFRDDFNDLVHKDKYYC